MDETITKISDTEYTVTKVQTISIDELTARRDELKTQIEETTSLLATYQAALDKIVLEIG